MDMENLMNLFFNNKPIVNNDVKEIDTNVPYTYVKKNIKGYYVAFPKALNPEEYNNLGSTYADFLDNKWVLLSEEQVNFHNEHPDASVREVWNMEIQEMPKYERTIDIARNEIYSNINYYFNSINVNTFIINDIKTWFTNDNLNEYRTSINALKLLDKDIFTLFINDQLFKVNVDEFENILAMIQLYIDECKICKKQHELNIENIDTIDELDEYDYKTGYPNILTFTIENYA